MKWKNTEKRAINLATSGSSGKPYEDVMAKALSACCIKNNCAYKTIIGTEEDRFWGTDFRIYGNLSILTSNAGILRMDFTTAFSAKDNMPLIWEPYDEIEIQSGIPLKFGIRTGNKSHGFKEPVIIVGFDAIGNEDSEKDVDVAIVKNSIQAFAAKKASSIIFEAGQALAAYHYSAEESYRKYVYDNLDEDNGLWEPDISRLKPNYDGQRKLLTYRSSRETAKGLYVAQQLIQQTIDNFPLKSPERQKQKDYLQYVSTMIKKPFEKYQKPEKSWEEQFADSVKTITGTSVSKDSILR